MQRKLPGIDIPAATEAKILHAAAFLEVKSHVERLAREGSDLKKPWSWRFASFSPSTGSGTTSLLWLKISSTALLSAPTPFG